jgi:hypothetical protein
MLPSQYPIRDFIIPSGYAPIQTSVYNNANINNLYLQFSASLGQLGSLVSNKRIQGYVAEYNSYVDYLEVALYELRSWYNGGIILPNVPTLPGTISAYWVNTNTSTLTNVPLFQNVVLGTTSQTVANIQAVLPIGYVASIYNSFQVYIECQYTENKYAGTNEYQGLNYIYWVLSNGQTGWVEVDYLPSLFLDDVTKIINNCKLIQNVTSLANMEYDNAYVSTGQTAQAAIPNPSTYFNYLNFANGVSYTNGITIFLPIGN